MSTLDGGRNLTHQVTYNLGAAIVRGDYGLNEHFPTEAELCEQFDISRSVIREAVKMLTAKGLISSRPRQGIRVQPNSNRSEERRVGKECRSRGEAEHERKKSTTAEQEGEREVMVSPARC